MKKSILSLAIVALLFAGCSDKKNNEHSHEHSEDSHVHDDGTIHEGNHDDEHHQDEFKVEDGNHTH